MVNLQKKLGALGRIYSLVWTVGTKTSLTNNLVRLDKSGKQKGNTVVLNSSILAQNFFFVKKLHTHKSQNKN